MTRQPFLFTPQYLGNITPLTTFHTMICFALTATTYASAMQCHRYEIHKIADPFSNCTAGRMSHIGREMI